MSEVRRLIEEEIRLGAFPGAAWAFGTATHTSVGCAGRQTYCSESRAIDDRSVWDLASVSKVVATTSLAMRAYDTGGLELDRPVAQSLPSFGQNGKGRITPRNLLRHDAGLVAFRPYHLTANSPDDVMKAIDAESLVYETGTKSVYSDLSMIVLARLLSRLDGRTLEAMVAEEIARPLGLQSTGYCTPANTTMSEPVDIQDIVPTEIVEEWRIRLRRRAYGNLGAARRFGDAPDYIRAEVHDPTATALGGVAGHAGLFASRGDLVRFARNMLSPAPKIFSARARELFTSRQEEGSSRALGWDTKSAEGSSAGLRFGSTSFGHTGYTGTSIWIDPDAGRFAILLTNRVHPTSANTRLLAFRPLFHDAVWHALDSNRTG